MTPVLRSPIRESREVSERTRKVDHMVTALRPPLPDTGALAPAADAHSYYSISQAAALLGVSRMSIWRWVRAGRLPVARFGHRTARIRREDLDRRPRASFSEPSGTAILRSKTHCERVLGMMRWL